MARSDYNPPQEPHGPIVPGGGQFETIARRVFNWFNLTPDALHLDGSPYGVRLAVNWCGIPVQIKTYDAGPPEVYTVEVSGAGPDQPETTPTPAPVLKWIYGTTPNPPLPVGCWLVAFRFFGTYWALPGFSTLDPDAGAGIEPNQFIMLTAVSTGISTYKLVVNYYDFVYTVQNGQIIGLTKTRKSGAVTGQTTPDGAVLTYRTGTDTFEYAPISFPAVPDGEYHVEYDAGANKYKLLGDSSESSTDTYYHAGGGFTVPPGDHTVMGAPGDPNPGPLSLKLFADDVYIEQEITPDGDGGYDIHTNHIGPPTDPELTAWQMFGIGIADVAAVEAILGVSLIDISGEPRGHVNYFNGNPVGKLPTPSISPATGTYTSPQTVTISDTDPAVAISYRISLDGGSTWGAGWLTYTAPITGVPIASGTGQTVIQAYATRAGWTNSATATATYTLAASFTATGGTVTTSGAYTIHTFTGDGTFTVTSGTGTVYRELVGAGGPGGPNGRGGGGGGQVVTGNESLTAGNTRAIVIGICSTAWPTPTVTSPTNSGWTTNNDTVSGRDTTYGGSVTAGGGNGGADPSGGTNYQSGGAYSGGSGTAGIASTVPGSSATYAAGGPGGSSGTGAAGTYNGDGAGGGGGGSIGGPGAPGIVHLWYLT